MAEPPTHVLTDKYRGVPGYGWVAIVGVGAGAGWILIRKLRGRAAAAPQLMLPAADTAGSTAPLGGGFSGSGSGSPGSPGTQPIGVGTDLLGNLPQLTAPPAPGPVPNPSPMSSALPIFIPSLRSQPTGDPEHDNAIKDPAVSAYLENIYQRQQSGQLSKPTGDVAHDTAIQNPAVSAYLQSLYNAQQPKAA